MKKLLRTLYTLFIVNCSVVLAHLFVACDPEPPLHLYDAETAELELPLVDLELELFWDYDLDYNLNYGTGYSWKDRWFYGWDSKDRADWGEIGYTEPKVFDIRRYYTGDVSMAPHTSVLPPETVEGTHFEGRYNWGFWDILVWNHIKTADDVHSLIFDEQTSLDSVTAMTGPSMNPSRYHTPRYTHAFYQPEELFAAYKQGMEINRNLDGFTYVPERNVWVRRDSAKLVPITYIYLVQVILHNNKGRVKGLGDDISNISGLARTTNVNLGRGGNDAISIYYNSRMKNDVPLVPYGTPADDPSNLSAERADIIGGRLMTFGICNLCANAVKSVREVVDANPHYMDVTLRFYNDIDSTLVFNVSEQVSRQYKGGVISVELDLDTVPIPVRSGGSGFNAVVKDFEEVEGIPDFEM